MNLDPERVEYIKRLTENLPPFSITITDHIDAGWLVSACIGHLAGTDKQNGEILGMALGMSCKLLGVEEGVEAWVSALNEHRDKPIPKFIKPMMIFHFNHIKEHHDKQ